MTLRRYGEIKMTHIPTGEYVLVNGSRSHHENLKLGLPALKSKLYALEHGIKRVDDVVGCYELPEDLYWPDNLRRYKVERC